MGNVKRRKQAPRALRHIERQLLPDIQFVQRVQPPAGSASVGRLGSLWQSFEFDAQKVASSINFRPGGFCFCDSSVYIKQTDDRIWDAVLRDGRLTLIPPLLDELQWWLQGPAWKKPRCASGSSRPLER